MARGCVGPSYQPHPEICRRVDGRPSGHLNRHAVRSLPVSIPSNSATSDASEIFDSAKIRRQLSICVQQTRRPEYWLLESVHDAKLPEAVEAYAVLCAERSWKVNVDCGHARGTRWLCHHSSWAALAGQRKGRPGGGAQWRCPDHPVRARSVDFHRAGRGISHLILSLTTSTPEKSSILHTTVAFSPSSSARRAFASQGIWNASTR